MTSPEQQMLSYPAFGEPASRLDWLIRIAVKIAPITASLIDQRPKRLKGFDLGG